MMRTLLSFSPLLSLTLSLLVSFQVTTAQNQSKLIQETCKICAKNDPNVKYSFCTTSLEAAPASGCASLHGLGMISIRLIRTNLTDTRCYIKQLLKNEKIISDPSVKGVLEDCLDLYSDAIPSVKQAMKHYNSKLYADANVEVGSVMDAATTCEDGFKENDDNTNNRSSSVVYSRLTKRNNDSFELSAIALSIMRMLQFGMVNTNINLG